MGLTSFSAPRLRGFGLVIGVAGLAACADFPELDSALTDGARDAPYPALLPVEALNARIEEPIITDDTASGIEARVASLRARAALLRRTVIDGSTRQRMSAGVEEI